MTVEDRDEKFWKEWQDILLEEFECKMAAVAAKGQWVVPTRKTLTILFLQVKGFSVPAADILPEAIRTIMENDVPQSGISSFTKEYDSITMMGHRIGMVDNGASLKQYLQDVRAVLKPEGQILLTSFDKHAINESGHRADKILRNKQFQRANLIGPFFNIMHIKADTLKSWAAVTNWHCEFIYRLDDTNYIARLSLLESEYPN